MRGAATSPRVEVCQPRTDPTLTRATPPWNSPTLTLASHISSLVSSSSLSESQRPRASSTCSPPGARCLCSPVSSKSSTLRGSLRAARGCSSRVGPGEANHRLLSPIRDRSLPQERPIAHHRQPNCPLIDLPAHNRQVRIEVGFGKLLARLDPLASLGYSVRLSGGGQAFGRSTLDGAVRPGFTGTATINEAAPERARSRR